MPLGRSVMSQPQGLSDALLSLALAACQVGALPLGTLHGLWERVAHPGVVGWLAERPGGAWRQLRRIRFIRLARTVFKVFVLTGWDGAVLRRIVVEEGVPTGRCVLAICHSAWSHAAVRWLVTHRFALLLAGSRWVQEAGDLHALRSSVGLRRVLVHLRAGGRAAVAVDSFAERGGSIEQFLGVPVHVSLIAARLAGAAHTPLVPTWVSYRDGRLRLCFGDPVEVVRGGHRAGAALALKRALGCFERWIREDPGEWNNLMRFLHRHPALS